MMVYEVGYVKDETIEYNQLFTFAHSVLEFIIGDCDVFHVEWLLLAESYTVDDFTDEQHDGKEANIEADK